MRRFLVTGGSGFIGSAVVRRLIADGHEVVAPSSRELDLLSASNDQLARFVADMGVTHCIHAAWYTNHPDYLTHGVNRDWLAASLRLARACQGMRFVGLGTCLEYDVADAVGPLAEASPVRPETLYARCKLDLFRALETRGSDFAWARVFFVYGPGDRGGRLIPHMIEQFSRGQAAGPTYGGLKRDYVHVDDLAGQLVRIATLSVWGAINTGTGTAPTLSEIFAAGATAFGRSELAQLNAETGGQPLLIQPDMERFRREVGDAEARSVAAGLKDLVA